jgi:hypothetical protein
MPPLRVRANALLAKPVTGLPLASSTTMIRKSVFPDATVGLPNPTVKLDPLMVWLLYVNLSALDVADVPYPKIGAFTLAMGLSLMLSVSLTPDWTVTSTV